MVLKKPNCLHYCHHYAIGFQMCSVACPNQIHSEIIIIIAPVFFRLLRCRRNHVIIHCSLAGPFPQHIWGWESASLDSGVPSPNNGFWRDAGLVFEYGIWLFLMNWLWRIWIIWTEARYTLLKKNKLFWMKLAPNMSL